MSTENNPRNDYKYMDGVVEQGTTYIRTESLRSSQVRCIGLSSSRCVDRATKNKHQYTTSKNESITFESVPTQPFRDDSAREPCRRKRWLPHVVASPQGKRYDSCLPTVFIVSDLKGEFFPRL